MKKKIGIFIGLALVALLVITVVVMTIVQVNYKPEIAVPNSITILNNEGKSVYSSPDHSDEVYDETLKHFEQSFSRSFLSAFFAGQVNNSLNVVETTELQSFTNYKITLKYEENQVLKEKEEKYNNIIIGVTNSAEYQEISIYFQQAASTNYYYVLKTFVKQNVFFDYLETLTYL